MRMTAALLALAVPATAAGAEYRLRLQGEKIIRGNGGLHAADSRTEASLVRVVSSGIGISKRGTIRVLVMNLGAKPFAFGPADVRLRLPDGSELPHTPLAEFQRGAKLVSREMQRAANVDRRVKSDLSALAQSASTGVTVANGNSFSTPAEPAGARGTSAGRQDRAAEKLPGSETLNAIADIMRRTQLGPQEAAGGYLVFEMPKELRARRGDEPVTIVVRTGAEEHRFEAILQRR